MKRDGNFDAGRLAPGGGLVTAHMEGRMPKVSLEETEHVSLCEALDRILNKGAVVAGEVTISVADIDLIYLGLQVILTSVETARQLRSQEQSIRL